MSTATQIQTFLYFAYGSNLLAQRIHIQNPTAVRKGIGKLSDYQLDFDKFSNRWGGCSATIRFDPGKHVWGAIWEIDRSQLDNLDMQEGVNANIYLPLQVKVFTPENKEVECRVYKLVNDPEPYKSADLLPKSRRPSKVYLETILQGAKESKLPEDYFNFLKSFPHNGFSGPVEVKGLNLSFIHTDR